VKKLVVLSALLLLVASLASAETPKKGNVILSAGWSVSAPTEETDSRVSAPFVGVEGFVSDNFSLGISLSQANTEEAEKIYAVTMAPRWGNFYFPIGLVGAEVPDRTAPVWGYTGGIGADFWNGPHLGLSVSGHYNYLQSTQLDGNFFEVRGALRFKF